MSEIGRLQRAEGHTVSHHVMVTCAFCGESYGPGTPTSGALALEDHIRACPKHPMRLVEAIVQKLLSGALSMVGVSTLVELHEMRMAIPLVAKSDPDAARACIPLVDAAIEAMERGFRPDLTRTQEARALALVSLKGTEP